MTLSLTVIMMEATVQRDLRLPIMLVLMTAKIGGRLHRGAAGGLGLAAAARAGSAALCMAVPTLPRACTTCTSSGRACPSCTGRPPLTSHSPPPGTLWAGLQAGRALMPWEASSATWWVTAWLFPREVMSTPVICSWRREKVGGHRGRCWSSTHPTTTVSCGGRRLTDRQQPRGRPGHHLQLTRVAVWGGLP